MYLSFPRFGNCRFLAGLSYLSLNSKLNCFCFCPPTAFFGVLWEQGGLKPRLASRYSLPSAVFTDMHQHAQVGIMNILMSEASSVYQHTVKNQLCVCSKVS